MKTWTRTRSAGLLQRPPAGHSARASRLALCLGLALAAGVAIETTSGPSFAQSAASPPPGTPGPAPTSAVSSSSGKSSGPSGDSADRLAKRRERLQQGAKRLRDRAAEIRQRIAKGEKDPPAPANSKRPPRSLEEQARRFEEQATKMEERARTLEDTPGAERSPELARQRRHQLRRAHLNKRWGGATLRDPEAVAELKVHAERVARLKRIRSLASKKSKEDPAADRAKALLNKEEERHEQHMKAIQARVAPAGAGAPAEPAAEPAAAPEEESK